MPRREEKLPHRKLYIDSKGVKRGYYVYIHKDRATGEVFYVGKGSGKRATDTQSRSARWWEKVRSLSDGWGVDIVGQDMSELEAFSLEAELVDRYREAEVEGNELTNVGSGGETTLSCGLRYSLEDHGWSEAYATARVFKDLPRDEEKALAGDFDKALESCCTEIEVFKEEAEEAIDEEMRSHGDDLDFFGLNLRDAISDFLRRRLSWKELALFVEEMTEDIEDDIEALPARYERARALYERLLAAAVAFLGQIDSGNRKEAEAEADRATGHDPTGGSLKP